MTYTPADFSPVFGPDEPPVNVGWYPVHYAKVLAGGMQTDYYWVNNPGCLCYWGGDGWHGRKGVKMTFQNWYWFGLLEKAK